MFCQGAVERRVTLLTSRSRWSDREVFPTSSSSYGELSQHNGRGGGQEHVREWLTMVDKEDAKPEQPRQPSADLLCRNPSSEDDLALGVEASLYGKQGATSVQAFLRSTRSSPAISRWNSLNSAGSVQTGTLSLMDVLNLWADDPEEVLLDMGFGSDEPDISCRIPARFINHQSQARGINIQVFLEAQKSRLDLENPDVSNRFRQLEVLQQVTTAFTSIVGPSSGAPPGREQSAETRERRRRIGNLLRRASKKFLSEKQNQSIQAGEPALTPDFPDTPPQLPQPVISLVEKQAPPRRTRQGLQESISLSPLVEEQGLVTEAHPQPPVSLHAQDGGSRLGLGKEVHPLTSSAVLYRKRNPGPAKESFEMEEIQSFDEGSFTGSYTGTADSSTVRYVMVRTNSCQSDSSGFLEEPFIPALIQLQQPAASVTPGPELIKALSGMSGSSTDSQVTVKEGTSDPPSPTAPSSPSLPPTSSSASPLPPSSSPIPPSLPRPSSPLPPSLPRSSSPISLSLLPSSSPIPPPVPSSPFLTSDSLPSSPISSSIPPPSSPSSSAPPPFTAHTEEVSSLTDTSEVASGPTSDTPTEGPGPGAQRADIVHMLLDRQTTKTSMVVERSSHLLSEEVTEKGSLGSEVSPAVAVSTGEASLVVGAQTAKMSHFRDMQTWGSSLSSAIETMESCLLAGSEKVENVSEIPDEKARYTIFTAESQTDGCHSTAETNTEENPILCEKHTEETLLISQTPGEQSSPLPDVQTETPSYLSQLQNQEAGLMAVTLTEEVSWTFLKDVPSSPSASPPSSENTLSSLAPSPLPSSPHSPSSLPSSSLAPFSPPSVPSVSPPPPSPPSPPFPSPPPPSLGKADVLARSPGAEEHSVKQEEEWACGSSTTGARCHNNIGGDGGWAPVLAPVRGVIKPETDGSSTGPLVEEGAGLTAAAGGDRLKPAPTGLGPGVADGRGSSVMTSGRGAQSAVGGLVQISSLDLVFGSTSVDDPDGEWPCEDVDAVCRELDSDGYVYWAEPIQVASPSPSSAGTSRAGSVESTDRPLVVRPDSDLLTPTSAFDSGPRPNQQIKLVMFPSQSQTHQNRNATTGVTVHSESQRKTVFRSSRSVSVQMPSALSSSHTVSKTTVKRGVPLSMVSTAYADSHYPVHLHQSEADLTPRRSVLAKRAWSDASSSRFLRGNTVATETSAWIASPLSSADLGLSSRDGLRSATGSLRTKSVSLDTGLWPGDEEEEEERREDCDVARRWEGALFHGSSECCACEHRCSCCRQNSYAVTQATGNFPYSVDELEELMRCLKKFRLVLTNIEEHASEDQASVYSALSSTDREGVGDIVELRKAVKKEAEELEMQLNDLVHHYDDTFKMKMHRLLDEQSLLCSELRLLPSATTPTNVNPASSRCASTQCCLLPWLPLMDRSETRLSSRGTWDLESSRPSLLGCDSIVEGLDDPTLKPDKLDFVGFLQRLKESLRNSINADSLE